jgi:predicted  nucleic acid-binding Zn-ribbon protein
MTKDSDVENSISAVNGNISALKTKINAGQEELRQEISAFQERIKAGQAEFEERVTRNLREDLSRNTEATRQDFETQLGALEVRTSGSCSIVSLNLWPTITIGRPERKPLTF